MKRRMSGSGVMAITVAGVLTTGVLAMGAREAHALAVLEPAPTSVNFGDQRVAVASTAIVVGVTNTGTTNSATGIVCTLENDPPLNNPADFAISACPSTLAIGAKFDLDVTFTPSAAGARGARIHIVYNNGGTEVSVDVPLLGSGIDAPNLLVNSNWSPVALGSQHIALGATTPTRLVTMQNTHPSLPLSISAYNQSGANCADFNFSFPGTPTLIAGGASTTFSVTFDPTTAGAKTCVVTFVSNDPDAPAQITVTGSGVDQTIAVSPTSRNYGSVPVSDPPATQSFNIDNDGDQSNLSITGVSLSGAQCGHFVLSGVPSTPFSVAPAGTEEIAVAFDPTARGSFACNLVIVSNDPTAVTTTVPLTGTGLASDLDLTPASPHAFGSRQISKGATPTFTVTMTNNAAANDNLIFSNPTDFDTTTDPDCVHFQFAFPATPLVIIPGNSATFTAAFDPSTVGSKTCDITIYSNDPAGPQTYRFTGVGTQSLINLTPDPRAWGNVVVNSTVNQTVAVQNSPSATATLTVNSLALSGTHAAQFAIISPATPFTVNANASQNVTLSCTPTSTGPKTATLTATHDADVVTNADAALTCTGVKPDVVLTPPPAYTFGNQQINTTSATTRTFTVAAATGTYASALTVSVGELSGDTGHFLLTSTNNACLAPSTCSLSPGSSANFTVSFRPTTIGAKSEMVRITTDDQDAGQNQIDYGPFTGNGINPEIETTTGSTFNFGDVLIGSPEDGTITIRNAGTTNLEISSVVLTGGNAADFSIPSGPIGASTLIPSATANWTVRCNPSVEGARTTTFRVASNDHDEANFNVTLNCTGTAPELVVTPNPIAFAPTYDCTQSAEMTVTLRNQGSASLSITGISSGSSTFSITTPPAGGYPVNLSASGGNVTIGITFIPPGVASYNADLTINWDNGPTVVSMSGDGRLAAVTADPLSYDYGDVRIDGAAVSHVYTIENTGTHGFDIDLIELDNTTDFTLVDIDALGATLDPAEMVTFQVDALPVAVGGASATVAVTTSLPDTCAAVLEIDLSVAGVIPGISLAPVDEVAFGPQDIQAVSPATQTVVITNSGTAVLSVSDLVLTGDGQFALAGGQELSFQVAVGATSGVVIEYVPTMVENNTANLEVTSDAGGGVPVDIDITGRGIDRELNLSATALDFPATYRNTETPSTLDFVIDNLGEATLNITTVDEGGAGASAFALAADVPSTVAGSGSATVTVEFRPTAAGLFEAYLELSNDDTDEGVARIDLSGLGRVPNIATPALPVDLGRIGVGVPTRLSETGASLIQLVNRETDSFTVRELRLVDSTGTPVDPEQFRVLGFTAGSELAGGATLAVDVEVVAETEGQYEVTLEVYLDADPLRVAIVTIRANAVPVTLRGGGCQVGDASTGAGAGLLLVLALALLAVAGRRRRRLGAGVAMVAVVGLTAGVARADLTRNLDLTTFRPMPGVDSTMISVEVPEVGAAGAWFLGFFFDHAVNPLNLSSPGEDSSDATVSGRTAAELAFSYALRDRYEVGVLVPMLSQSGDPSTVINGLAPADGMALGDTSLHGKVFLFRAAPITLGASTTLTLPTASDGEFAGANGPTAHMRAIAGLRSRRIDVVVNGGLRLRGKAQLADIEQGNEVTYGFAVSYQILGKLAAIGEVYGALSLAGGVTTGVNPLETALGVRYRLNRELGVVVGGGSGLMMPGVGTADLRGFLLLAYSSRAREIARFERIIIEQPVDRGDDDGDGVINSEDRCPDEPEDVDDFEDQDGCPDPDNDGDGLADGDDPCPLEAEDKDGFKDDDGCPDVDNDGDGIVDAEDRCPSEPEDKDGFEDRDGCDDPDNDGDGIPDVIDECALEPETINGNQDDDGCPDPGDSLVMVMPDRIEAFEPVRFRGNSADVLKKSERVLAQVAATLRANRDFLRIRIAVHLHPRSGNDLTLTKRRAEAVRKWLINWGVEPERLEIKGYGSSRLLVPKNSRGASGINDRVEFILLEKRVGAKAD